MTGLMMKDALVMRKTLRLYALFLLFYSGLAVLGVFPMSVALAMVEVIVMVLPISSFSYDEAAKWDRYAAVLPVGRTAVVKARYLFLLLVLLAAAAIGLVGSILGLPVGTGGSGGAAGHPAGLYGLRADDRGHYAAGGLSAGAGAGPALDVCHHFCPYRGAAGGRQAGPLRWDRPGPGWISCPSLLSWGSLPWCHWCPWWGCSCPAGSPAGSTPGRSSEVDWERRPCGAERRWGWRWLSSVLPGASSRTVRRPGE